MFIIFQERELTKNECYLLLDWSNNKKLKFTKIYRRKEMEIMLVNFMKNVMEKVLQ